MVWGEEVRQRGSPGLLQVGGVCTCTSTCRGDGGWWACLSPASSRSIRQGSTLKLMRSSFLSDFQTAVDVFRRIILEAEKIDGAASQGKSSCSVM